MPTRARYSRRVAAPTPPAIEDRSWEIFTAHCHKRRTFEDIGTAFHLSPEQVRRIVEEVGAQLGRARAGAPNLVVSESPVEDLGLSVRTRNALRGVGCETVEDALRLDLSSSVRGLGRKTRSELLTMLERSGFLHPSVQEQPVSEIRMVERSLERIESRIDRALGAVAKEIGLVKQRLRGKMAGRNGKIPERATITPASHPGNDHRRDGK
jgi:hypothetical protein